MPTDARIAVTGIGIVSPAGCTPETFHQRLESGLSTAAALTDEEFARHPVRIGCRVQGLTGEGLTDKELRRLDPFARFGLAAATRAHRDGGEPQAAPGRTAIVVGNAVGGRRTSDDESAKFARLGPRGVSPLFPLASMPNAAAALISMRLGWTGPATTIATTCASSADAIGHGMMLLQTGRVDLVLAGGCESIITPVTMAAFGNLTAVSARNDAPQSASRPFDAGRDGFVMGEGAGFVLLERAADAKARGARVYGNLAGYATGADAYHLSQPLEDGSGAVATMSAAIADAGLEPADIVHVNAHGTSTVANDRAEATALRKVFGPDGPPVTSTKGVIGHLIGAAGAVELIATLLAMRAGRVPPTANHERTEPQMEIDVVHGAPRQVRPGPALSNSFGFGGHNACLVVEPS